MTDHQLIRWLAERAMRWPFYDASHHRPGSRPSPYAWPMRSGRAVVLMVSNYADDGVVAGWRNVEWNPLTAAADADALLAAIAARGTPLEGQTTDTPEGRRTLAEAARTLLTAEEQ
jgi:hypothetical protein